MKSRNGPRLLAAVLAAGLLLGACVDDRVSGLNDGGVGGVDDPGGIDPGPRSPQLPAMYVQDLKSPLRISEATGVLLVTDSHRDLVLQMDPRTMSWGRAIHIDGKPLGVAYWDPFVFVGNAKRQTVEVYLGQGGSRLTDFGRGRVGYPSAIAVDRENSRILVVDGKAKDVKVFTPSGDLVLTMGRTGAGNLKNPIGVAVDSVRGEVLVTDYGDLSSDGYASIKIFDLNGSFQDEISGAGVCGGGICTDGFSRPQGVTVGLDGRIYLADALVGRVLVYDRATLMRIGEIGDRNALRFPTDVAVGAGGDLFIVSNGNREVRVLRRGTAP